MTLNDKASESLLIKASNKFKSAVSNITSGRLDSGVSDLYYSTFQTICALMVLLDKSTSKHTHVRAFVNKDLALKGLLSVDLAKMYNKLMDMRSDADYSTEITFSLEEVEMLLEQVEVFNKVILDLVKKNQNNHI